MCLPPVIINEQMASMCPPLDASRRASLKHDGITSVRLIDDKMSLKPGLFSLAAFLTSINYIILLFYLYPSLNCDWVNNNEINSCFCQIIPVFNRVLPSFQHNR